MVYAKNDAGEVLSKTMASLFAYCTPDDRNEIPSSLKHMFLHRITPKIFSMVTINYARRITEIYICKWC